MAQTIIHCDVDIYIHIDIDSPNLLSTKTMLSRLAGRVRSSWGNQRENVRFASTLTLYYAGMGTIWCGIGYLGYRVYNDHIHGMPIGKPEARVQGRLLEEGYIPKLGMMSSSTTVLSENMSKETLVDLVTRFGKYPRPIRFDAWYTLEQPRLFSQPRVIASHVLKMEVGTGQSSNGIPEWAYFPNGPSGWGYLDVANRVIMARENYARYRHDQLTSSSSSLSSRSTAADSKASSSSNSSSTPTSQTQEEDLAMRLEIQEEALWKYAKQYQRLLGELDCLVYVSPTKTVNVRVGDSAGIGSLETIRRSTLKMWNPCLQRVQRELCMEQIMEDPKINYETVSGPNITTVSGPNHGENDPRRLLATVPDSNILFQQVSEFVQKDVDKAKDEAKTFHRQGQMNGYDAHYHPFVKLYFPDGAEGRISPGLSEEMPRDWTHIPSGVLATNYDPTNGSVLPQSTEAYRLQQLWRRFESNSLEQCHRHLESRSRLELRFNNKEFREEHCQRIMPAYVALAYKMAIQKPL